MGTAAERRRAVMQLKTEMAAAVKAEKDRREKRKIETDYQERIRQLMTATENEERSEQSEEHSSAGPTRSAIRRENRDRKRIEQRDRLLETLAATDKSKDEEDALQSIIPVGFMIEDVQADGSCLFHAIAHQLNVGKEEKITGMDVRRTIAAWIRQNADLYQMFVSDVPITQFCDDIEFSNAYGGEIEIKAASEAYGTPIHVYTANGIIRYNDEQTQSPLQLVFFQHKYASRKIVKTTNQSSRLAHYNVLQRS